MNSQHRTHLEEEKKILVSELSRLGRRNPETNEWEAVSSQGATTADSNSNADRFEDFEEASALIAPLEARLAQVEAALAKLKDGGYGLCRVCNNPIEDARLSANPAAETCMAHLES